MKRPSRRLAIRSATILGGIVLATVASTGAASAHPLGNATVNHYDGLTFSADKVQILAVEDVAEIPTLQRRDDIDTNGDGRLSVAERSEYAAQRCTAISSAEQLRAGGPKDVRFRVATSSYTERPGAIQLKAGRLSCELTAPLRLTAAITVSFQDNWDSAGIGWHEVTAVGTGVSLQNSPFPATSISDQLRRYPGDLLSSPLDVQGGQVRIIPGGGNSTYAKVAHVPVAGFAARALNDVSLRFNDLVGAEHLTVGVGLLAVLLAMVIGAGHAFLPGHGKTIMAAYLVGRRGRRRDVILVGATVTLTHTFGVLFLGALISLGAAFAPTEVEQDLAIASGLIVAAVGVGLLASALRRRKAGAVLLVEPQPVVLAADRVQSARVLVGAGAPVEHQRSHDPHHDHDHDHHAHHEHSDGKVPAPHVVHRHGWGHHHSHGPVNTDQATGFSRAGLVGLGMAGGLVPSPSALLVLLAAGALGRTVFGIGLVFAYGIGMALALTLAGLLLVSLRDRIDLAAFTQKHVATQRLLVLLPVLTSLLVLAVGVGLTLRAVHGAI